MKSVTLTKQMREDILTSVLDKWAEINTEPDLVLANHNFATWLWRDYYKKERDLFDDIPNGFLNISKEMRFCVNGEVKEVSLKEGFGKPVDWVSYRSPVLKTIRDTHKEYTKYEKVSDAHNRWRALWKEVSRETRAILESVNTTRQLLELWPQSEPFLPAHIADPDRAIRLPAIQMSRLNERLGIAA